MCGIIGAIGSAALDRKHDWIDRGRDKMAHRGPDSFGSWISADGSVCFGHRRLAIVDLSDNAHQPMFISKYHVCVVFNGEIYNHRELRKCLSDVGYHFESNSDTEVIVYAYHFWGSEFVKRLRGMFAFAIYDEVKQVALMGRDRAGEKPLFYHIGDNGELSFASELKGLLENPRIPRAIDIEALDYLLAYGYVQSSQSIISGVRKLPPAHLLTYRFATQALQVTCYWRLDVENASNKLQYESSFETLLDELDGLLLNAVDRQLNADVPVGVFLSGGLDSSLVTALAAKCRQKVMTFNVRFPNAGRFDESEHARLIANHFDTDHFELPVSDITPEVLSCLARQFDEPMIDSSMVPTYLISKLVRNHCTVALGGDGGDELFGGYKSYSSLLGLERRIKSIPLPFRKPLGGLLRLFLKPDFRWRYWIDCLADQDVGLPISSTFFDPTTRTRLVPALRECRKRAENCRLSEIPNGNSLLARLTKMDFANYMVNDVLVKVDRSSMLASLEVRAPILDHDIIEFAFNRVPDHFKAVGNDRKILLKAVARRHLPGNFEYDRKQGFAIPLDMWLSDPIWRNYFLENLVDRQDPFFTKAVVKTLFSGGGTGEKLFSLLMIQLSIDEYKLSI